MHLFPHRASLQGLEVELFKLVSFGATPEQWAEWLRAPLEHAAVRGNLDLVNRLLRAGASGKAGWRGCRGRTLLDAAALGGNPDVLAALLRTGSGPDVNAVSVSSGRSPLHTATFCGHEAAARQLILAGADLNFRVPGDTCSVLTEAVRGGQAQLVHDLLIAGAHPGAPDRRRRATPLHFACAGGDLSIVSALLLAKAVDKDAPDSEGETPLIWAVKAGRLSVVETLLAAGADSNVRRLDTYSALDLATERAPKSVLEAIVRHGADVNAVDPMGLSALHSAAIRDRGEAVHTLARAGADVEMKTGGGWTPLHGAARHHSCTAILALLQNKAAVNAKVETTGDTPLHRACSRQHWGVDGAVDLLLRWGADETAPNALGRTPADVLGSPRGAENPNISPDQVERARLLLARAPRDRVWRRRGWLLVLRSRAARETASHHTDGRGSDGGTTGSGGFTCAGVDQEEGQHPKAARNSSSYSASGGAERGRDAGGLAGLVRLLMGLGPEPVFRSVLGFL